MSAPPCSGTGTYAFVGGSDANVAGGAASFVGAGHANQACDSDSVVVGGYQNTLGGSGERGGFIGAGTDNVLSGNDVDAVIVGGYTNAVSAADSVVVGGANNSVSTEYAVIGSGQGNVIDGGVSGGWYGAITSGFHNTLSGQYGFVGASDENNLSAEYGFIGAGTNNTVSGEGGYVAAGGYDTVTGEGAVIDGGFNSTTSGTFATIPGGYVNVAAGTYSFAAGARAKAAQAGTFVWSDGSDGDTILTSSRQYQFLARASGGFTLYTNAASTVGAQLAAGSGTWASLSDRNMKSNITPLDDAAVLDKVAALPISRWSYKSEHGVRHVGPMAQDFYAAFKVGEDDKHITSIDEDGVALAAIKALHARVGALDGENARLRAQLARYRATTDARLARLTAAVAALHAR
jgi:uncharacterized small protein (DUF1192 family)